MKKNLLIIAAIASATLVSCSNEEFGGEEIVPITTEEVPIDFGSYFKAMTRADVEGAAAADLLGNKFVVSGYKGNETKTVGSIVFDNYKVVWNENSAHTTASNSSNWEYVGVTPIKHAIDNGITAQKIKYWDFSKDQYDFIAWSTGKKEAIFEGTPGTDQVLVSAITPGTATTKAYTFSGTADALSQCYIADLVTVNKTGDAGNGEVTGYGNPVTFRFRQLGTKVRIALYETVPGYSVKDVQFYSAAASNDANADAAKLFTTSANEIYTEGIYTVYFPTIDEPDDADNNQAHVSFSKAKDANDQDIEQSTIVNWGGLNYTIAEDGEKSAGKVFLGRTSSTASFAGTPAGNYYKIFLPNSEGTNLNLRVNYTLESTDGSGEVITVKGATAQVPAIYTQWKPGFAYTYIFKISDKTNGTTGEYNPLFPDDVTVNSDPTGLYPITFDAVVVNAEDGNNTQETITTVSTPSFTTYQEGSDVVNNNEYLPGKNIYIVVSDGTTANTPDLANGSVQKLTNKVALYSLPATLPAGLSGTEAEVIDALQMQDDDAATGTVKGRSGLVLTEEQYGLSGRVQYGADGNPIIVGADKVATFAPEAGKTYAFVYTKKAATANGTTNKYQPVTKAVDASVAGLYRYNLVAADATAASDVKKGVKYFANNDASTGMITAFIGQGVSNLYTRSGAGTDTDPYVYSAASGYAETGTTYYYSYMDGQVKKYKAAHNVDYEVFKNHNASNTPTLYKDNQGTTVKPDDEKTPVDGQAYYYKETDGSYTYCVILPQKTTGLYVIDEAEANRVACGENDKAVDGMTYFDMYTQNDGVYYAKVIKVQ
ncbi:MAG: hypothetical protein IKN15_09160 [Bacteroidaceae bacterium]|nr:hypothetical protein [Bacteroidaceae bacterium]